MALISFNLVIATVTSAGTVATTEEGVTTLAAALDCNGWNANDKPSAKMHKADVFTLFF